MGRRVVFGGCHPRSGKTVTLRLSGGCHPTERSWMEVGHVLESFILRSAQQKEALHRICPFSRVYDHSLPHSRLAIGEWCTCALLVWPLEPLLAATPDCASDPLAGPVGQQVPPILLYFYFIFFFFIYLQSKTIKII
ncbi:unnamed protein product [Spirodela intermedia]|uniref:Uncharacterized protein n=1 Tax=Spirodela intermedia TaxID=51605 RepID=A0A7I8IN19_SPIIN|nr:unnamed protein product [Spirodela intermedia]CAA6658538.1 unnamed protein product [Spirodela intermedia]